MRGSAVRSNDLQRRNQRRFAAVVRACEYRQPVRQLDHGFTVRHEVFERDPSNHFVFT